MKNQQSRNTSEVRAEQVTSEAPVASVPPYEAIYLGTDLHKESIVVTRMIDHATAQPAQRFSWEEYWRFVEKQRQLARQVYVVYEAGAFGFWVARKLNGSGVQCYVVHPEKLDPRQKRVQTDQLDSRQLCDKLQRYVRGNKKAMVAVYIPSEAEEQMRIESRHRRHLSKQLQAIKARGQGLLLSQGIFATRGWWKEPTWVKLGAQISAQLRAALEDDRARLEMLCQQLRAADKRLVASAPQALPVGFGQLTFVLLLRELCNYRRFQNRRGMGGFTGLCGAVSSSGPYHVDLSINKAGRREIRRLAIELAWRMIFWQPNYKPIKAWKKLDRRHPSHRKRMVVGLARQLMVDLWRWQTGRVTPEQLGWEMTQNPLPDEGAPEALRTHLLINQLTTKI